MTKIFHWFLCERWIPCQASTSVLCLHYRPKTVHSSTKDAYTSEITFLALRPWLRSISTRIHSTYFSFFPQTLLLCVFTIHKSVFGTFGNSMFFHVDFQDYKIKNHVVHMLVWSIFLKYFNLNFYNKCIPGLRSRCLVWRNPVLSALLYKTRTFTNWQPVTIVDIEVSERCWKIKRCIQGWRERRRLQLPKIPEEIPSCVFFIHNNLQRLISISSSETLKFEIYRRDLSILANLVGF